MTCGACTPKPSNLVHGVHVAQGQVVTFCWAIGANYSTQLAVPLLAAADHLPSCCPAVCLHWVVTGWAGAEEGR
jgi:hypothetical protein